MDSLNFFVGTDIVEVTRINDLLGLQQKNLL